jgi:3-hydroxyisobutyrate dehydrogenase-like beta-hydroxyacid dehydrogenase
MTVGVIGLGHMGSAMATSLLRAGLDVTVYNRTREKAAPLVAKGAHLAASVSDACRGDAVITMLANDKAMNEAGFAASLGQKDIGLVLTAGEELRVPLPIASLLRDRFLALAAQGGGHLDWSAISELAALDAGAKRPQQRDDSRAA